MTFKHVKFEDSAIMRSLEKVAREKGMVKDEPLNKTASVVNPLDLKVSYNLMENVLKLCAGLRASGLDKHANELESNYLSYKQANTLYETSKEKGEDLIHDAHPEGSHKIEDILGDDLAVVEDILDRHVKMVLVVEKKPTGKLASSKSVINAVKNVFAQDTASLLDKKLRDAYQAVVFVSQTISNSATPEEKGATTMGRLLPLMNLGKLLKQRPATAESIKAAQDATQSARAQLQYMDPREIEGKQNAAKSTGSLAPIIFNMTNYTAWNQVQESLNSIKAALEEAAKLVQGDTGFINKIVALTTKLNSYRALLEDTGFTPQDRADGNAEITGYINTLTNWKNIFSKLDPETRAAEAPRYEAKLNQMSAQVEKLHAEIIGQ